MLSTYDEHTSSLVACPTRIVNPKENHQRSKKSRKKIEAAAIEAEAEAQNNRRNNSDSVPVLESDDISSDQYGSKSVDFNSCKRNKKKSSSHRSKAHRQMDQQNHFPQDHPQYLEYREYQVDRPEPEQNIPRRAPVAPQQQPPREQAAEMRMYLDKLRELVPQLPKKGKIPRMQLIQHTIDYICDLQQALEDHPRLRGLDPRLIAAPGNLLSPMQIQRQFLQQLQQQQQQQLQQQQQQQQQQLLQQQQYHNNAPHFNTPYSRTPLVPLPSGHPRLILQARRDTKMTSLRCTLCSSTTGTDSAPPAGAN